MLVKRTAKQIIERAPESFGKTFEENKKPLGNNTMPSKRIRNMIAGYVTRIKMNSKKIIAEEQKDG